MESKIYASVIVLGTGLILWDQGKSLVIMFLMLPPFLLIWFAEALGSYIGPVRGGYVNKETPPWLLAGFGFLVLGFFFVCLLLALKAEGQNEEKKVTHGETTVSQE